MAFAEKSEALFVNSIKNYLLTAKPWVSAIVIAVCLAVWFLIKKGLGHFHPDDKRKLANLKFGQNVIKYIIAIIGVLTVLQINGVNVTSLITGLGVAGVVVGFALEDLLKDIINGANIMFDDFFKVGDMVEYNPSNGEKVEGRVTEFNLKATKILDVNTGNKVSISNRNISEIQLMSDWMPISVPVPYSASAERAQNACLEICRRISEMPDVTSCDFIGIHELGDSGISYRLTMHCPPEFKKAKRLKALQIVRSVLEDEKIEIPFNRLDVSLIGGNYESDAVFDNSVL